MRKMAVVYGLGGSLFDPANGEVAIIPRYKGIGIATPDVPFNYTDSQAIHDFLKDADWRGITADSFGADYEVNYAPDLEIDYAAGFAPSMYADNIRYVNGIPSVIVPANYEYAHAIRDPLWWQTLGLSYAQYVAADPKKTIVVNTIHQALHPDDFGYAQDLIFDEVRRRIGA